MESKRKTIPCKFFFEAGHCRKDQECDFSHDPSSQQNNQGGQNNRGAFGFSRGRGRGGGGRFGRGSSRGGLSDRGGSHSNYHDDPSGGSQDSSGGPSQQNNFYGNSRGRGPYRARPDYQYQSKPKTDHYGDKPSPNDKGKMSCKYFRMGTCNSGVNCKFSHTWTDNDDLGLAYLRSFGDENVKTDDFEIRDVCIIDSSKKIVAFAQPKSILFVDFNSNSNENQEKIMDEAEELTCMRYFENALFVGIFNTNKNCSIIKVIQLDGSEMTIEPAHQDYIVDICNIRDFIITASLDTKIKFWKMNQIALKFEVVFTQNHKEMSKMKNITYNGIDSLFVANNDFSLSIYSIDYSIVPLNMNMIANYENYHGDIITNLKFFSSNQQTRKKIINLFVSA